MTNIVKEEVIERLKDEKEKIRQDKLLFEEKFKRTKRKK